MSLHLWVSVVPSKVLPGIRLSHNNADLILLWVLEGYYKLNFLHEIKGMYEIECTRCVQETAEQGH